MILDELAEHARERVALDKEKIPLEKMKDLAFSLSSNNFRFEKALKENKISIIAEVKKASPSKGVISKDFPYIEIAKEYEKSGATCVSVLTEPKWFLGSDIIFRDVRRAIDLPIIRKDFTIDEYQIYQSKVLGADAVLLICALLDTDTIREYLKICKELELSAIVETHNEEEIESALKAGAKILGVNNRNLKDFTVNLGNASDLKKYVPDDIIFVAESGILSSQDGINLAKNGANALLIGEALMKTDSIENFINEIKDGV